MSTFSLMLFPFGKQGYSVPLICRDNTRMTYERLVENTQDEKVLFSDLTYEFELTCDSTIAVQDVKVYINDVFEPSELSGTIIRFPESRGQFRRVFLECYGFVEISLDLKLIDGTALYLHTNYLPVLVKKGVLNDAVKEMVSYLYSHQEALLLNGEPKPKDIADLQDNGTKSLSAYLILLENIANLYESSYSYFKANARSHIEKTPIVDRLEKLHFFTPATMQYIVSHPEQLSQVNNYSGIRVATRVYHPQKVLALQNVLSYDTYENRVVLGFLRRLIIEIERLQMECQLLLSRLPSVEQYSEDYIYSPYFMFCETKKMLENGSAQILQLYDRFTRLLSLYCNALPISSGILTTSPASTPVFRSVPQYRRLFICIYQWFNYGIYSFENEAFILSFVKISLLYESYLLAKLIDYFQSRGYDLHEITKCNYPTKQTWKYENTRCNNTFLFEDDQERITLYYQPVVYDTDQQRVNGIGIYRNNSISDEFDEDAGGRNEQRYYTPDFIIKVESNSGVQYLILDAKFSHFNSVKRYSIKELAFKYIFSISSIDSSASVIKGLSILYAKCSQAEQIYDVYDKKLPGSIISPSFQLIPLMEGISTDEHFNRLDQLFNSTFRTPHEYPHTKL